MEICFDTIQDQLAKHVDLAKIVDFNALSQKPGFKIEQCNSWIYIGQMMNGKKNGTGILKIVDSLKLYIGEWVVDQKQGLGYEKFSNGAEYYGSYENNKQNGYGEYFWVNGEIYKGHWIDGQKSGYGEWLGQNSWYKGEWKNGYVEGRGVYQSEKGDLYTGDFVASMKHGMGEERFSNGDLFRGNFINGKPEGYGEYVWKSGSLYQGFFLKGMRHGQGVWQSSTSSLCDKYDGAYQFDKKSGYGEFIWANGTVYKGQFQDDLRQGYGEIYSKGVLIYQGEWERDVQIEKSGLRLKFQQKQYIQNHIALYSKHPNVEEIKELEEESNGSEPERLLQENRNIQQKRTEKFRLTTLHFDSRTKTHRISPMKRSLDLQNSSASVQNKKNRVQSQTQCKTQIIQQHKHRSISYSNQVQITNKEMSKNNQHSQPKKSRLKLEKLK
ncbi:unnamed protein product (macronuclear) [Paramecium tetraurelia]|uniref:MORN repeat protein n=1 Tax=Paramecium tetraurelia TaxID=5888 RepID=A0D4K6_PARTE|nr:uncharacterized protein GSPATT00039250001 [Paramecium tetraurelia]CAK77973.1 unnamed protein product [Paramecium tetraurelia]|eukprot:XP_001445370.1 hypothetical protein (macronuclear) [Paramecium tetraurelia strain d4-2]